MKHFKRTLFRLLIVFLNLSKINSFLIISLFQTGICQKETLSISIPYNFQTQELLKSVRTMIVTNTSSRIGSEYVFNLAASFYGLGIDIKDIRHVPFDSTFFNDSDQRVYPVICLSDYVLEKMTAQYIPLLKTYINNGGVLLINDVFEDSVLGPHVNLRSLTDSLILGGHGRGEKNKSLIFSSSDSTITDVFTGLTFQSIVSKSIKSNHEVIFNTEANVLSIVNARDSLGTTFPFFVEYRFGSGRIFISSAWQNYGKSNIATLYQTQYGASLLPSMMTLKSVYGNFAWHGSRLFANLTIDDPPLANNPGKLDYLQLFNEMRVHNFHTTIAYIPKNYIVRQNEKKIVNLFESHPEYFSIVQHGDFHTPHEFFTYSSEDSLLACQQYNLCGYVPHSLQEQEVFAVDGLTKLTMMQRESGLLEDRIMIYPWGPPPSSTNSMLNNYLYEGVVGPAPILSSPNSAWDAGMRIAEAIPGNLPVYPRSSPYKIDSLHAGSNFEWGIYKLFIRSPALYYSHIGELFPPMTGFNATADSLNGLTLPLQWKSLGYILSHSYLQKDNGDASDSIWLFANHSIVRNDENIQRVFHILRTELNTPPLQRIECSGNIIPFTIRNGYSYCDIYIGAKSESQINYFYSRKNVNFAVTQRDVMFSSGGIDVLIHNFGDSAGVCSVVLKNEYENTVVDVESQMVPAHGASFVHFSVGASTYSDFRIMLNPLLLYSESDTTQNQLNLSFLKNASSFLIDQFDYSDSPFLHGWFKQDPQSNGSASTVYDINTGKMALELSNPSSANQLQINRPGNWLFRGFSMNVKSGKSWVISMITFDSAGHRYVFNYSPDEGKPTWDSTNINYHLGKLLRDGFWHKISRNFITEIHHFNSKSSITNIIVLVLRGDLEVDSIFVGNNYSDSSITTVPPITINPNPTEYQLFANYPNPFNPSTTIYYSLSGRSSVDLKIFNILGEEVASLVSGDQGTGNKAVIWNGEDKKGYDLPSGIYFYRLQAVSLERKGVTFINTKKMLLLR